MTCDQAELRMAELLAGEIAREERSALEKHLLDCAACRGDFELARAGARIDWADVAVPREVIESTLASFREPAPVVRFLRGATAAAAALGVAALLLTSSRAERTGPEPARAVACSTERPQVLATMQDAVVGALVCKDEAGRPVGELSLKSHEVRVEILDGIAKTTVEENFENHTDRRLEGAFHFPLPSDASISRLALEVNGKIEEGTCLERERAREVFESIVRKMQDPALLEWQPGGIFKCRVFPIEPRSTKRVIVAYTQALPCFQGKMTYVYPLASEKTRTHPPGEASIEVQARFSGGLAKIGSPSHHLEVQRKNPNEAAMAFRATNYRPNNDFVVTLEPDDEEVRVVSHKTDGDDGYFACFAVPRGGGARAPGRYAFVIDASASISAPRLEVAKRLVRAMMERRIEGDRFEILAHNIGVERSGEVDLRAANDFMDRLRPIGGSDVLQALLAAGDAEVIYIGKGAATFGETEPSKILEAVKGRRIRTIAVGSDANGVLLERLGGMMRVNPNDDVTKRVEEIAATLGSPVLGGVKVEGGEAVYDVVGVRDLFFGERLVVSGRYRGPAAKLVISGRGYRREVDVAFPAKEEGNNYVRRLWAQRKVSDLLAQGPAKKAEVTDLGVKYQIMTPYTSFLVLETEQMWKDFQLQREVQKQDEVMGKPAPDRTKANDLHRIAERYFQAGKYAEAQQAVEQALRADPGHAPSKALFTENAFILGAARAAPQTAEYDKYMKEALIRTPAPAPAPPPPASPEPPPRRFDMVRNGAADVDLSEFRIQPGQLRFKSGGDRTEGLPVVGWHFADGKELEYRGLTTPFGGLEFALGDHGGGSREHEAGMRVVMGHEALSLRNAAAPQLEEQLAQLLDLTKAETPRSGRILSGSEMEVRAIPLRNSQPPPTYTAKVEPGKTLNGRPVESPRSVEDLTRRWDLHRQLEGLLTRDAEGRPLGNLTFDPQTNTFIVRDTPQVMERVAKTIEAIDGPSRSSALEQLLKLREAEEEREFRARGGQGRGGKGNDLEFPSSELWKELVAKRQPKGISEMREGLSEEDKVIVDKLRSIRVTVDLQNAPMTAIVDRLRELSGLNIHLTGVDDPNCEAISFKVRDLALDQALRRLLEPRNRTYRVRDGVVLIAHSDVLEIESVSEDGTTALVGGRAMAAGKLLAITRDSRFVAILRIEAVHEGDALARVLQGLAAGRLMPGDRAQLVGHLPTYFAKLPAQVRNDLASRVSQRTIRAKMGLKE